MAELNKGQLTAENTASFPNNTVGYITPDLLRTFNQNMIDSLVDEIQYNADSASVSASIAQLKGFSASLDNTYATDAQLNYSSSVLQGNINASSSILQSNIDLKVNISQTSSMSVLSSSYAVSASYASNVPITASYAISSSQATSASYAITASHATNVPATASFAISASQAVTASFLTGFVASASFATNAETASFLLGTIASSSYALSSSYSVTSSFAETSSFALTSSITQQVSTSISTQNIQHNVLFVDTTGPGLVQVDGGLRYNPNINLLTTTASLALTASFAENIPTNFATTGSNTFIGNQIISGNLLVTGSTINLEVDPPALGGIGTTNVKAVLDTTASAIVTSLDLTRQAAGPTGDLTGVRLQTFSGSSDTSGDRLLSRVNTGVNRNTSTGLAGSTVNTQINAVWATGSSAFTSQIVETASSGSANLFLNAGNLASNYAGGTASLQAGRVNIGALGGTISSTGSLAHSGSVSIQNGVLQINGQSNNSSIFVSGATTTLSGLSGSVLDNLGSIYTASSAIKHVVNLGSSSYASLLAASQTDANTLYVIGGISDPYVLSSQTASFQQSSSAATTGSNTFKATQIISSSVRGEVKSLSIASNTASLDLSLGNFFTLQLVSGAATHINPTNILPGQTINILVSTTGSGTVTFPTSVDQVSGSSYVPTATTSKDILTLVAFDTSIVYLANVKNLI